MLQRGFREDSARIHLLGFRRRRRKILWWTVVRAPYLQVILVVLRSPGVPRLLSLFVVPSHAILLDVLSVSYILRITLSQ